VPGGAFGEERGREQWEDTVEDAIELVSAEIAPQLTRQDVTAQRRLDDRIEQAVPESAAATIARHGVSCAGAEAGARVTDQRLFEFLAEDGTQIPEPVVNVLGGGSEGARAFGIQHLSVCPAGRSNVESALRDARAVRDAVRSRIEGGGQKPLVDSEGSFVPDVASAAEALELLTSAIRDAGFSPAVDDIGIAVDFAGGRLYDPQQDGYPVGTDVLDDEEMTAAVLGLVREYPVVTIEDPLRSLSAQWRQIAAQIPAHTDLLGDQIRGETQSETLSAIDSGALSAVLVKPDRYGTVTTSLETARAIAGAGATPVVSARAGDSGSTVPVDIALAVDSAGVKIGSLSRFERTAKFNRLLLAERERIQSR
jgi:enolase